MAGDPGEKGENGEAGGRPGRQLPLTGLTCPVA